MRPETVTRTYNGVRAGLGPMPDADVQAALRTLGLPPRYFLYLGTIEPRKNLMTLLHAYVRLPADLRDRFPLLLVGGWGWNSAAVAAYLDGEARHRGVVYTGYLPEQSLAAVLNGARALVYPSLYEGFGLPPVEMMACGGAVLCSTAGALVETVGARAHLVEPLDEDGWREALRRAAVDDDWHAELRRGAAEVVRPYTWDALRRRNPGRLPGRMRPNRPSEKPDKTSHAKTPRAEELRSASLREIFGLSAEKLPRKSSNSFCCWWAVPCIVLMSDWYFSICVSCCVELVQVTLVGRRRRGHLLQVGAKPRLVVGDRLELQFLLGDLPLRLVQRAAQVQRLLQAVLDLRADDRCVDEEADLVVVAVGELDLLVDDRAPRSRPGSPSCRPGPSPQSGRRR